MARLFVDITPLRKSPQYRRLWFGYAVNQLGSQLTIVAVAYQVYKLTGSSLDVGLISLAQLGPAIIGPIIGGSMADAIDRRTILLFTNIGGAACTVGLAVNASVAHPAIWPLYVCGALSAATSGVDQPTRNAMMIMLVKRDSFVAANALRTLLQQIALVVGPSVAGLLLAGVGIKAVFWIDVATFGVALLAVASLHAHPPSDGGTRFGLQSVLEGFQFLRGRQAVQGCFYMDLNAMILGMPTALFPALGVHYFHGGAQAVGYLYAAPGAGAFLAAPVQRLDPAHRPARTGGGGRRRHLGHRDRHLRSGPLAVDRPGAAGDRRWRRRALGRVPQFDHSAGGPGSTARPVELDPDCGRHRWTPAGQQRGRPGRRARRQPVLGRLGRPRLPGRPRRHRRLLPTFRRYEKPPPEPEVISATNLTRIRLTFNADFKLTADGVDDCVGAGWADPKMLTTLISVAQFPAGVVFEVGW